MTDEILLEIIRSCRRIDKAACDVYDEFARLAADEELRKFWQSMAAEESEHVGYWDRLLAVGCEMALPQVFDDPFKVREELQAILPRAEELLATCRASESLSEWFLLAYRLEFIMLHPAFGMLFDVLQTATEAPSPGDLYEQHLDGFIEMLARREVVSPELALVGETLRRLRIENRELVHVSSHDLLTSLYNRAGFLRIAQQVWHLARRHRSHVGVLAIDIDRFKSVNDAHGHATGDTVLASVAGALRTALRQSDLVARFGGDEFVALLPDVQPEMLPAIAEKARAAVQSLATPSRHVTVSVGAAGAHLDPAVGLTLEDLLRIADENLYAAKQSGRDRVVA